MDLNTNKSQDHVNLVVFKDNYAAKAFDVPLSWINRLGILLGGFFVLSLFLTVFSIRKSYFGKISPSAINDQSLLKELNELKIAYSSLQESKSKPFSETTCSSGNTLTGNANEKTVLFSALPLLKNAELPELNALPFRLDQPKAYWNHSVLQVEFNIQYAKGDGGNQQGRIIVLARGQDRLSAYPSGVINRADSSSLLNPEKGEFFSVSRFRIGKTTFGPYPSKTSIQDVQILIFNKENDLLFIQNLLPETGNATPKGPENVEKD